MIINKIKKALQEKGALEVLVYGCELLIFKISSLGQILLFKIRGYDISFSVLLRGKSFLFQSTKHAISIEGNSIIGKHTRISCGENGKIKIKSDALIDDFTYIMAHKKIEIGKNTQIASFCFITDFNHNYSNTKKPISTQGYKTKSINIGDNVWIGTHVVILPGVKIGNSSIIGAGSVVVKNIPNYSIAVGNPAKVVKKIKKT